MSNIQIVNQNGDVRGYITMCNEVAPFIEEQSSELACSQSVLRVPDYILNTFLLSEEQYQLVNGEKPLANHFLGYHESSLVNAILTYKEG